MRLLHSRLLPNGIINISKLLGTFFKYFCIQQMVISCRSRIFKKGRPQRQLKEWDLVRKEGAGMSKVDLVKWNVYDYKFMCTFAVLSSPDLYVGYTIELLELNFIPGIHHTILHSLNYNNKLFYKKACINAWVTD